MRNSVLGARTALLRIPDRVNVLAGASVPLIERIVADVRRRHPGASCHAFLTADAAACAGLFDSTTPVHPVSPAFWLAVLRCAFGPNRAGYCVLPLTREGHALLKFVFWFLPLGRRELYNENLDLCSARDIRVLPRHFWWRTRHLWWRLRHPQRPTVTVLGTASGLYLKKIVAELRERYPGAPVHGLLPARLVAPAGALFDSHTIIAPFSFAFWRDLARLALGPSRSGHLIIACTSEGFSALKLAGPWLPFGLREVFNENADSYPLRDFRMLVHHILWRLQYRIFYQAISVCRGRSWPLQAFHLLAYPLRLLPGILLLARARLRALTNRLRKAGRAARPVLGSRIPAHHETQLGRGEPVATHRSGD